ncbi:M23 family metallopeptidase, partial [bacterium]|nr:M23 family metallopeptidase [bacterium]
GTEVLAVADSIVANAKDDIPEYEFISTSQRPMPLENASGNYVTLNLGNGRYAFYEHLKHGSIKVKPGDRIKSGQVIGMLGNSGSSSSGPHLHFHVSDANSTLAAEGMPYVFKNFEVLGAFQTIDAVLRGQRWEPAPKNAGGARRMELPAPNVVILFPQN